MLHVAPQPPNKKQSRPLRPSAAVGNARCHAPASASCTAVPTTVAAPQGRINTSAARRAAAATDTVLPAHTLARDGSTSCH
eukprot:2791948-Prymnesium_polylepis.1